MTLHEVLRVDLERQYFYEGVTHKKPSTLRVWLRFFSPRFMPVVLYRLANASHRSGLPSIARLFSLVNFIVFGLEIAVRCDIGPGLFLPHTQGTVIGARRIGRNAVIYHNVTFGSREVDLDYSELSRPTIGDDVIVGAGAKVLGGIFIGDRARIAANAVVITDVPQGATAAGVPAKIVKLTDVF